MDKFLEELTELSRKHNIIIGSRHDGYYAPVVYQIDGPKICDELQWDEENKKYIASEE